ncbi:MAG: ribonuclease Z [Candidatus Pacearchaeota archaeon]
MELTFLGTSQAIPTERRNHTAILLEYEDESILIDCGEGTQRQFRKAHLNPCKITKILISHWHGDHVLGLPGLLQTLALNNYQKTLDIYGPKGTKKYIELMLNMFIFKEKIKVNIHEISQGVFFESKKFLLEAFPLEHSASCLAYVFKEKDRLRINKEKIQKLKLKGPIIGELQKGKDIVVNGKKIKAKDVTYLQKGKKITFIMDTSFCIQCFKAAEKTDILISEATYSKEMEEKAKEYKHLTAVQAAEIAKKSKAKELWLTHLSQRYEKNPEILLKEAKKVFKNTKLAEDLMKIKI